MTAEKVNFERSRTKGVLFQIVSAPAGEYLGRIMDISTDKRQRFSFEPEGDKAITFYELSAARMFIRGYFLKRDKA